MLRAAGSSLALSLLSVSMLLAQESDLMRLPAGVTRSGEAIPSLVTRDDFDYGTQKLRILIAGGGQKAVAAVEDFYSNGGTEQLRARMAISALPGVPVDGYPPAGEHYNGKDNAEAQYCWRWIGMHAPDLVVVLRDGPVKATAGAGKLGAVLGSTGAPVAGSLAFELSTKAAADTGTIPAIEMEASKGFLAKLAGALKRSGFSGPSPARREIQQRLQRSPLEIEKQLALVYGKDLPEAVYIPAMALVGRLRLGTQTQDPAQLAMVEKIVEPYFTGARDSMAKPTGSHLSGHMIFGELHRQTQKARYLELVKTAADTGFEASGAMKESMPMHMEMSDAVFMGTPIVAMAGRLTGDRKYYDMALRHMRFMLKMNVRADGLHRHSPLDETAWGRGNGFPALGLALTLSELPPSFEGYAEVLAAFRAHMDSMVKHQDAAGMWHQVVDRPESYREFTVTAMTTFAMRRGIANGWLDKTKFQPAVDRAWYALRARIAANGGLVDVCTGTGKQKSLREYYDRGAILGTDPRGGGMAWLVAAEMQQALTLR